MRSVIRLFSRRRWLITNLIAPLVVLGLVGILWSDTPKPPLLVSIVPSASSANGRTIGMAHQEPWTFYVLLTNVSNEPQTVWEDGNSWGYQVISFEVMTAPNGQKTVISKQPQAFAKNTPRTFLVRPGEQKVYEVRLNDDWVAHPAIAKVDELSIKLRVRYDTSPSPEAARLKVWVGHVESKQYDLTLRQW